MRNCSIILQVKHSLLPVWVTVPLFLITSAILIIVFSALSNLIFQIQAPVSKGYLIVFQQFMLHFPLFLGIFILALLFLKYIDRRPISDLGLELRGRGPDFIFGALFASILYVLGFGTSLLLGVVKIVNIHFDVGLLAGSFVVLIVSALMEEIMIRGYILSRLMLCMNKFLALFLSSAIFGLLHVLNPNIGFLAVFNVFLAGLMLGAAFLYTRNLWFPIILHVCWNWLQGPVLGYEVSGIKIFPSAFTLHLPQNNIFNGGTFGFEGSIICTVLLVMSTGVIICWFENKSKKARLEIKSESGILS